MPEQAPLTPKGNLPPVPSEAPDFQEIVQVDSGSAKGIGMRMRSGGSKGDPFSKLKADLVDINKGIGLKDVFTLKDGPYVSIEALVTAIDKAPPSENIRKQFTYLIERGIVPLIWQADDDVILGIRGQPKDGTGICTLEEIALPFSDEYEPQLKQGFNLEAKNIRAVILSSEEYNKVTSLIGSFEARQKYLGLLTTEASAQKVFTGIVRAAVMVGASDIHIEPYGYDKYRIRYRKDGVLRSKFTLEPTMISPLMVVIKQRADLPVEERRKPLDGRIHFTPQDIAKESTLAGLDLRVSIVPTVTGPKCVCRVLKSSTGTEFSLDKLGLPTPLLIKLDEIVTNKNGIILVTGPTGSGKTTTLYSILNLLNTGKENICTIEDPVEVPLKGINQVAVNKAIELTFAEAIKRFMRQDPDIILVGEIRDSETAEAAVQAALTGHLVFATLHTNDSFGTIPRLRELGIPNTLLHETIRGVLSQRLVRVLCDSCKEPEDITPRINQLLKREYFNTPVLAYRESGVGSNTGKECGECMGAGFVGRQPVPELWIPGVEEKGLIIDNKGDQESFYKAAVLSPESGMDTMFKNGLELVRVGKTSLNEVLGRIASINYLRQHPEVLGEVFGH